MNKGATKDTFYALSCANYQTMGSCPSAVLPLDIASSVIEVIDVDHRKVAEAPKIKNLKVEVPGEHPFLHAAPET